MIFTYNKEHVGDVLMVILQEKKELKRSVERKGKVARIYADETGQTLAWNIFEASSLIAVAGNGQVFLTDEQVAILNAELAKEGFADKLEIQPIPSLWLVKLRKCKPIQTATTSIFARSMWVTRGFKS